MLLTDKRCNNLETGDYNISNTYIFVLHYKKPESNGVIGAFRHLYMDEWISYTNTSNLIYQSELLLQQIKIPQATTCCRKTWGKNSSKQQTIISFPILEKPIWVNSLPGKVSYMIHIRYRHNSSWQGEIRWLEQNKTMFFRSVLELIMLLENSNRSQEN